jgi:hypothetical protein
MQLYCKIEITYMEAMSYKSNFRIKLKAFKGARERATA